MTFIELIPARANALIKNRLDIELRKQGERTTEEAIVDAVKDLSCITFTIRKSAIFFKQDKGVISVFDTSEE